MEPQGIDKLLLKFEGVLKQHQNTIESLKSEINDLQQLVENLNKENANLKHENGNFKQDNDNLVEDRRKLRRETTRLKELLRRKNCESCDKIQKQIEAANARVELWAQKVPASRLSDGVSASSLTTDNSELLPKTPSGVVVLKETKPVQRTSTPHKHKTGDIRRYLKKRSSRLDKRKRHVERSVLVAENRGDTSDDSFRRPFSKNSSNTIDPDLSVKSSGSEEVQVTPVVQKTCTTGSDQKSKKAKLREQQASIAKGDAAVEKKCELPKNSQDVEIPLGNVESSQEGVGVEEFFDKDPSPLAEGPQNTPNGRGLGVDKVTFLSGMELGNKVPRIIRTRSCEELSAGCSRRKMRGRRFLTPIKSLGDGLSEEYIKTTRRELEELAQTLASNINKACEEKQIEEAIAAVVEKTCDDPSFSEFVERALTLKAFDLESFLRPLDTADVGETKQPEESCGVVDDAIMSAELVPYPDIHYESVDCNIVMGDLDADGNPYFMAGRHSLASNPLCLPPAPASSRGRFRNILPKFGNISVLNTPPVIVLTPAMLAPEPAQTAPLPPPPPPRPVPQRKQMRLTKQKLDKIRKPKMKKRKALVKKTVPPSPAPTVNQSTCKGTPTDMPNINFFATPSIPATPAAPVPATPQAASIPTRQSSSTPRRKSHIRALEFETPPRSSARKRATTSPKTRSQTSATTPERGVAKTRAKKTNSPRTRSRRLLVANTEQANSKVGVGPEEAVNLESDVVLEQIDESSCVGAAENEPVSVHKEKPVPEQLGEGTKTSGPQESVLMVSTDDPVRPGEELSQTPEVGEASTCDSTLVESVSATARNKTVLEGKTPPVATMSPIKNRASSAWNSISGVSVVLATAEDPVIHSWDSGLRALVVEEDIAKMSSKAARHSTKVKKKSSGKKPKKKTPKRKKAVDPVFARATRSKCNIVVSPSKMNLTAKRSTYSISECSSPDGSLLIERTPAKDVELTPYSKYMNKMQRYAFGVNLNADSPVKPLPQEETPFTKLLRENVPSVDIDLSMITTPVFPETPGLITPMTPMPSRPTDYSSSSSYYKPDLTSPRTPSNDVDIPELQKSEEHLQDITTASGKNIVTTPTRDAAVEPTPRKEQEESPVEVVEYSTEAKIAAVVCQAKHVVARSKIPGKNMSFMKFQMLAQCDKKLCDNIIDVGQPVESLKEELEEKRRKTVEKLKKETVPEKVHVKRKSLALNKRPDVQSISAARNKRGPTLVGKSGDVLGPGEKGKPQSSEVTEHLKELEKDKSRESRERKEDGAKSKTAKVSEVPEKTAKNKGEPEKKGESELLGKAQNKTESGESEVVAGKPKISQVTKGVEIERSKRKIREQGKGKRETRVEAERGGEKSKPAISQETRHGQRKTRIVGENEKLAPGTSKPKLSSESGKEDEIMKPKRKEGTDQKRLEKRKPEISETVGEGTQKKKQIAEKNKPESTGKTPSRGIDALVRKLLGEKSQARKRTLTEAELNKGSESKPQVLEKKARNEVMEATDVEKVQDVLRETAENQISLKTPKKVAADAGCDFTGRPSLEPDFSKPLAGSTPSKTPKKPGEEEIPKYVDDGQFPELSDGTKRRIFLAKVLLQRNDIQQFLDVGGKEDRLPVKSAILTLFKAVLKWLKLPLKDEKEASPSFETWAREVKLTFKKISKAMHLREEGSSLENGQLPPKKRKHSKVSASQVDNTVAQSLLQAIDVDSFLSQVHGQSPSTS